MAAEDRGIALGGINGARLVGEEVSDADFDAVAVESRPRAKDVGAAVAGGASTVIVKVAVLPPANSRLTT
ncbi:MAG: hypothetical protein R2867_38670 [Caldilineaceae bacterium]